MNKTDGVISDTFEQGFLRIPFERQLANCDHYELAPLFRRLLPPNQPILEAGCGSGRWVGWFVRQGWQTTGIDWSEALCDRARQSVPGGVFVAGDMRAMPFPSQSFGSVISLGAVEHDVEGPLAALREYHRVLSPGGIAIITVPYMSPVRRVMRVVKEFLRPGAYLVSRRLGVKQAVRIMKNLRAVRHASRSEWRPEFLRAGEEWSFFQYNFTKRQMTSFLDAAGFVVVEEFPDFKDEGVLHNFGPLAGAYDFQESRVLFSAAGRLIRSVLPVGAVGYMLCCVARRPL
jgi:SAM-dependent methyltransferase